MVRAHVFIAGRVQGVFFRQSTKRKAQSEGLVGWVRNLDDGRVEAVFEGEEAGVKSAIKWCRSGPDGSKVDELEVSWDESPVGFEDFSIRY